MSQPPIISSSSSAAAPYASPPNWWSRNWKWFVPAGCLTVVLLFALAILGVVAAVVGSMRGSEPYRQALARARANPQVTAALGTPIQAGYWTNGSINVNGSSGSAVMEIPISGPRGKGTIYVDARKFAGRWTFRRLEVAVPGQEDHIPLVEPKPGDENPEPKPENI